MTSESELPSERGMDFEEITSLTANGDYRAAAEYLKHHPYQKQNLFLEVRRRYAPDSTMPQELFDQIDKLL